MLKKVLAAALSTMLMTFTAPPHVSAEQPAAENYRQMFRDGNFYVEYRMFFSFEKDFTGHRTGSANIVTAQKDGNRMYRETKASTMHGSLGRSYFENTNFSSMTSLSSMYSRLNNDKQKIDVEQFKVKKWPDVMYKDGKYYRFTTERSGRMYFGSSKDVSAIVLDEKMLNSPVLNPDEDWGTVRQDLALPDELALFYWNDPFRDNPTNAPPPLFNGSSKRTVEEKEYDCDQYVTNIKSLTGSLIAQEIYNVLYEDGKLARIQKYLIKDGEEQLVRETIINNLTAEVPDSAFEIGRKIKIYAAEIGDMKDLLEEDELVETLGGN